MDRRLHESEMGWVDLTKIVALPEGESGKILNHMTEDRASELASWYALSKKEKMESGVPDERAVAEVLGTSVAFVRKAKEDDRVLAKVRAKLDLALLYDVIETRPIIKQIAHDTEEKAEARLKAARTLEELAGNLQKKFGPPVAVTVNNMNSMNYGEIPDEELILMAKDAVIRSKAVDVDIEEDY